jgi:hypothetical protein
MGSLGVFRDEFYNAADALTVAQFTSTSQASGTLVAAAMAGARVTYVLSSGATALTTDTAANIIAQLQSAVAAAQKANVGGFAAALGSTPPPGVPNLFNMSYILTIENTNAGTLTITGGTGVTLVGTATMLTVTQRTWVVTVTGPASITMQTVGSQATAV